MSPVLIFLYFNKYCRSWKDAVPVKFSELSTKKLEETGFKCENGPEEMIDATIKTCKEKGIL